MKTRALPDSTGAPARLAVMESEHLGAKMSDEMEKRRSLFSEGLERASISGAAAEAVQRYGSAVKEHSVAYTGMDNEAGIRLTRGLKSVSESKINPDFAENNIKQQAGFSAEIKSAARGNAENIINKKPVRIMRTDDFGSVNDQIRDLVEVGPDGRVLPGSGVQMKFVGSDPKALLGKLTSQKYKKYLDADVLLGVADDDYAVLMGKGGSGGIIDQRIAELRKQAQRSEELGNQSIAEGKRKEIAKLRQIRKNLRKSGLTRKEAVDARLNPEISTAKDIAEVANRAGLEQAKYGAAISGSISLISNTVAFLKGDKTFGEAFGSTAAAAGKGAAASYATSFAAEFLLCFTEKRCKDLSSFADGEFSDLSREVTSPVYGRRNFRRGVHERDGTGRGRHHRLCPGRDHRSRGAAVGSACPHRGNYRHGRRYDRILAFNCRL